MTDTAVLPALDLITFARPGRRLDRAHLDRAGADALLQSTGTVSVALSEGRIAVVLDGEKRLARWHPSHLHAIERVFLGREGGTALFATDVGTLTDAETADLLGADAKFIDLRSISPELSPVDAEIAATS
ncbi:MAG: NUDIX-like domain-containing protein, partial [Pseudomonadota bacterium]